MKLNVILFVSLIASFFVSYSAFGEGGKVQEQNPVFDEDGNPVGIVVPVDCEKYFSAQSGAAVWFCDEEEKDD